MGLRRQQHNELLTTLGVTIATRRQKLGYTQQDLARESGLDRAFISNVEHGKRNPSLISLASLADSLNIRLSRLIALCEKKSADLTVSTKGTARIGTRKRARR